MTKHQSPVEVALEMIKELQEYERNGGKQAFKEALRKEFVQRSGHPSLDQPLLNALETLASLLRPKHVLRRTKKRKSIRVRQSLSTPHGGQP